VECQRLGKAAQQDKRPDSLSSFFEEEKAGVVADAAAVAPLGLQIGAASAKSASELR